MEAIMQQLAYAMNQMMESQNQLMTQMREERSVGEVVEKEKVEKEGKTTKTD